MLVLQCAKPQLDFPLAFIFLNLICTVLLKMMFVHSFMWLQKFITFSFKGLLNCCIWNHITVQKKCHTSQNQTSQVAFLLLCRSTAQTHYKRTLIQITADAADVGLFVPRWMFRSSIDFIQVLFSLPLQIIEQLPWIKYLLINPEHPHFALTPATVLALTCGVSSHFLRVVFSVWQMVLWKR
jgi:hypothetical protein